MPSTYSLWRSKTFWTLVFVFAFNGYSAISGQVPADWSVVINLVLTGLASVFHLSTGQSTTGTN
jgi:hypothetical protein